MAVNTYKPGELTVMVGTILMAGWTESGEIANLEFNGEGVTMVVGPDGDATYVSDGNQSATLTLNFKQDSDSNRVLGAYKVAGTQVTVTLKDNLGFKHMSASCMVKQHANAPYGRELSARSWMIHMPKVASTYPAGTVPAT